MRIDAHAHVLPPVFLEEAEQHGGIGWPGRVPDADDCVAAMDRYEIAASIVSLPVPLTFGGRVEPARARELARECNEFGAGLTADAPSRFAALACLPLPDLDAALSELAFALDELHLDGVVLLASYAGTYLGDARLDPLFDELQRRAAYVFVHPAGQADPLGQYFGSFLLELPFETARAVMNLVLSGTLARCPDIRFQFAHMGGVAPFLAPRLAEVYARFPQAREAAPAGPAHLRDLYWDTGLSTGPAPLAATLEVTDPSHVVFGTDWPFDLARPREGTDPAPGLDFLRERRAAVDGENALALVPRLAP